jgi:hypothetical protein
VSNDETYAPGMAFGLWLACIFGLFGLHRFYLGRPITGLLWLFTFGLLGVGQLVDLIRLRSMVEDQNLIALGRQHLALPGARLALPGARGLALPGPRRSPEDELRQGLLQAAAKRGGTLSVTQGVLATGKGFEEVEAALDAMAHKGYAEIDNHPDSGIVIYRFGDLA